MAESIEMFKNPFQIEDLKVFDDEAWHHLLSDGTRELSLVPLARAVREASCTLLERIIRNLPTEKQAYFRDELDQMVRPEVVAAARRQVLDHLFWELVYWRMPEEYEALTEGERLHPDIFECLTPDLRGKIVLDVGAGSGRATFECLRVGATRVHAVEPSPGLRRILRRKLCQHGVKDRVILQQGWFDALPLKDASVDVALACSAFTSSPEQGGDAGLAELQRVVRPGGKIIIIWPRVSDRNWLENRGFTYVSFPEQQGMAIHFVSLERAIHCAQIFYGKKPDILEHILATRRPEIPFASIGMHPPCDYCWLAQPKGD